jgi:hypothetical protein
MERTFAILLVILWLTTTTAAVVLTSHVCLARFRCERERTLSPADVEANFAPKPPPTTGLAAKIKGILLHLDQPPTRTWRAPADGIAGPGRWTPTTWPAYAPIAPTEVTSAVPAPRASNRLAAGTKEAGGPPAEQRPVQGSACGRSFTPPVLDGTPEVVAPVGITSLPGDYPSGDSSPPPRRPLPSPPPSPGLSGPFVPVRISLADLFVLAGLPLPADRHR